MDKIDVLNAVRIAVLEQCDGQKVKYLPEVRPGQLERFIREIGESVFETLSKKEYE